MFNERKGSVVRHSKNNPNLAEFYVGKFNLAIYDASTGVTR